MAFVNFNKVKQMFTNNKELNKLYVNNVLLWEKRESETPTNNIESEIIKNPNSENYGGISTSLKYITDIDYDYNNERFYVSATKSNNRGGGIIYIKDKKTPVVSKPLYNENVNTVCCHGGKVICTYNRNLIYSTDGLTFTKKAYCFNKAINDLIYGNGLFIAVGKEGYVSKSSDGITWEDVSVVSDMDLYSVAYGNGKYIAVGNRHEVIVSEDGINWDRINSLTYEKTGSWFNYIRYNDKQKCFYLFGTNGYHQPTYFYKIDSETMKIETISKAIEENTSYSAYDLLTKGDVTLGFKKSATYCEELLTYDGGKSFNEIEVYHMTKYSLTKGCWGNHRIISGDTKGYIKYLTPYIK